VSKRLAAVAAMIGLDLWAGSAKAQVMVYDATSYASLVRQAATALDQLQQLKSQVAQTKSLYDGFNTASHAGLLAQGLNKPQLRDLAPDIDTYLAAAQGDLRLLGPLGQEAAALRARSRLFTPDPGDGAGLDLDRAGDRVARDMALSQQVGTIAAARLSGLQQLTDALDQAPNARAVMDLQTRLAGEQAMIANDQVRLQGLAMTQEAEARLATQREKERAKAARAARMKVYEETFR
jgi:type IV secretion system protein VirB5